jgi:hypothetical protein
MIVYPRLRRKHMEDPSTMEDAPKWEVVTEQVKGQIWTDRLRVDTGFLYRSTHIAGATTGVAGQVSQSMAFVPDRATP